MSIIRKIRQQLSDFGIRPGMKQQIESLGIEITLCQFIVVVLSLFSVGFLFIPLFVLQDMKFILAFMVLSLLCMIGGIWFWLKKAEICEHPEDYVE